MAKGLASIATPLFCNNWNISRAECPVANNNRSARNSAPFEHTTPLMDLFSIKNSTTR